MESEAQFGQGASWPPAVVSEETAPADPAEYLRVRSRRALICCAVGIFCFAVLVPVSIKLSSIYSIMTPAEALTVMAGIAGVILEFTAIVLGIGSRSLRAGKIALGLSLATLCAAFVLAFLGSVDGPSGCGL